LFGPFNDSLAARDWAKDSQELGFFPSAICFIDEIEEPFDQGYDPGL